MIDRPVFDDDNRAIQCCRCGGWLAPSTRVPRGFLRYCSDDCVTPPGSGVLEADPMNNPNVN